MKYFLCSETLIKVIKPKEKSSYLRRFGKKVAIAKLNFEEVENLYNNLDEDHQLLGGFWCQEIVEGYIDVSDFSVEKVKCYDGFFNWIMYKYDLGKAENHCIIIGNICKEECITPIELFNHLK